MITLLILVAVQSLCYPRTRDLLSPCLDGSCALPQWAAGTKMEGTGRAGAPDDGLGVADACDGGFSLRPAHDVFPLLHLCQAVSTVPECHTLAVAFFDKSGPLLRA